MLFVGRLHCNSDGVVDINDVNCAGAANDADLGARILDEIGSIAGDTDGNGTVEFADFLVLSTNFNKPGEYTDGDFDFNGTVEFADFLILSTNFGRFGTGDAASVPEPDAAILLLAAFVSVVQWRLGLKHS